MAADAGLPGRAAPEDLTPRYSVAPGAAREHARAVQNPHPTRYAELNGVLHDLVTGAQEALGETFVGAYVQGSFALGAGDLHSDCDFLVVVTERPDAAREAALRDLHRAIPHGEGHWCGHLEGSYAVADDLRTVAGLGAEWLYVDHGWDEMSWSDHCNQPWTRWILREHGITLVGPCPERAGRPGARRRAPRRGPGGTRLAHRRRPRVVPAGHGLVPALPRGPGLPQPAHGADGTGRQQAGRLALGDDARRPALAPAAPAGAGRPRPRAGPAGPAAARVDGRGARVRGVRRGAPPDG